MLLRVLSILGGIVAVGSGISATLALLNQWGIPFARFFMDLVFPQQVLRSHGVVTLTARWTEFRIQNKGWGKKLRRQLEEVCNDSSWDGATCYVLTVNPEAMLDWMLRYTQTGVLSQVIERRAITVKWVCQAIGVPGEPDYELFRLQRLLMYNIDPGENEEDYLRRKLAEFDREMRAAGQRAHDAHSGGRYEIYESRFPHFYMAFLLVRGAHPAQVTENHAPPGTFGFFHLYPMFPENINRRMAIYVHRRRRKATGEPDILDIYYRSIVTFINHLGAPRSVYP